MKKNPSAKQRKYPVFVVFSFFFIVFYLITAVCVWAFMNVQEYNRIHSITKKFVTTDSTAISDSVFVSAFEEGKKCPSLSNELSKKLCYDQTSRIIADGLREELLGSDQDLMFVKPEGEKLYSLGWSGEVKDITTTTHFKHTAVHAPQLVTFLTRQCHYFNVYDGSPWGCEIYVPVTSPQGILGYVVRLVPLDEELWLLLVFFFPIEWFFSFLSYPDVHSLFYPIAFVMLCMILIPGLLAVWATKRNKKTI